MKAPLPLWALLLFLFTALLGMGYFVLRERNTQYSGFNQHGYVVPQPQPSTRCEAPEIHAELRAANEWREELELARLTPRGSVSARVAELQRIRRTYRDTPSTCLNEVRTLRLAEMDAAIEGMKAFMESLDATAGVDLDQADKSGEGADRALLKIWEESLPGEASPEWVQRLSHPKEREAATKAPPASPEGAQTPAAATAPVSISLSHGGEAASEEAKAPAEEKIQGRLVGEPQVTRTSFGLLVARAQIANPGDRDGYVRAMFSLYCGGALKASQEVGQRLSAGQTAWVSYNFPAYTALCPWTATVTLE